MFAAEGVVGAGWSATIKMMTPVNTILALFISRGGTKQWMEGEQMWSATTRMMTPVKLPCLLGHRFLPTYVNNKSTFLQKCSHSKQRNIF